MSGLAGLWYLDGRPVEPDALEAMSRAIAHRGRDGEGRKLAGSFGLACQWLWVTPEEVGERQPLAGRHGSLLAFDGRVDNRDQLLGRLELPPRASDAAVVLRALETWGEAALQRIEGDFALAFYQPGPRRLLLARDAMGVRPLYYFHSSRLFAFGSEIKALLAHPGIPAQPDEEGLAGYLFLGRGPLPKAERTCFAGIWSLPAAHLLVVEPAAPPVPSRYWDFDPEYRLRLGSVGEYVEAFRDLYRRAVARRARSAYPVAVSLSGGLDSSSIFCQAETLRRERPGICPAVLGLSYVGPEGSAADERAYLDEIERAYGVTVQRLDLAPSLGLTWDAERQTRASEAPMLDTLWPVTARLQEAAAQSGARRFLSGHWGDQLLHSTAYLVDLFRRGAWGTMRRHLASLEDWFHPSEASALRQQVAFDLVRYHTPGVLVPLLKRLRRLLGSNGKRPWLDSSFQQRVLRQAGRPAVVGPPFASAQAKSLYLEVRLPYTVQCLEWNNKVAALHGLDPAFPMLDRDLVAFLLATPGEVHNAAGVPRALIREALRGVLPEAVRLRRWKGDYSEPANQGAQRDFDTVRALFTAEPRSAAWGYVDLARLMAYLDRLGPQLEGPECTASWELTDLLGLEQWFRVFLNEVPARR